MNRKPFFIPMNSGENEGIIKTFMIQEENFLIIPQIADFGYFLGAD